MPRLWTANKNYTDSLNANTRYLVGASNGGCNYQTIPEGSTKRVLHGAASGACYYGNEMVPVPDMKGNVVNLPTVVDSLSSAAFYGSYDSRFTLKDPRYISSLGCYESGDIDFPSGDQSVRNSFTIPSMTAQQQNAIQSIRRFEIWRLVKGVWTKMSQAVMEGGWTVSGSEGRYVITNRSTTTVTEYNKIIASSQQTTSRIVPFTS